MESGRWYVKLGEESIGPLTGAEFRELASNGSIVPDTAVSPDQQAWTPARTVEGLTFPPAPPPVGPVRTSRRTAARRNAMWTLVVLGSVVLLVTFLLMLVDTPSASQPSHSSTGALTPEQQTANRTYLYWRQVSGILKTAAGTASTGVSTFRSTAASVDGLPTAGVDPDAISCALGFAALLKECADLVESENDPSTTAGEFVRGFYGGWSGDFQPLIHELEGRNDAHKALASHVKSAEQQLIQTRAILSSRYGVEFPAL
jgi:hypothetical protein